MGFKKGDKVRVKSDLVVGKRYYNKNKEISDIFSRFMSNNLGMEGTIIEVGDGGKYTLDIDRIHSYTDGMLEPLYLEIDEVEPYEYNSDVERLLRHVLKLAPQQLVNDALDKGDKERFIQLTKKYKKYLLTKDLK